MMFEVLEEAMEEMEADMAVSASSAESEEGVEGREVEETVAPRMSSTNVCNWRFRDRISGVRDEAEGEKVDPRTGANDFDEFGVDDVEVNA